MTICFNLKGILRERGVTARELSKRVGITEANLSHLTTGKSRAIRVDLLDKICAELDCQPGDILQHK